MITALLVNMNAEVKVFKYDTDSAEVACEMLVKEWKEGKIVWEWWGANEAFTPEWLNELGYPPEVGPEEELGVIKYEWWCCQGESESDDEIVYGYFINSI